MTKRAGKDTAWVECGRIGRPVGLGGDVAVFWNSGDCPAGIGGELFLLVEKSHTHLSYRVAALRKQGRSSVVRFEGIGDRSAAGALRGARIFIPAERLPKLPPGEYYCYQILGLGVLTENGASLGKIVRIFTAGENDVYEVLPPGGKRGEEILIPAIDTVVLSVDLAAGRMIVRPLKGMLDGP